MKCRRLRALGLGACALAIALVGCATSPYPLADHAESEHTLALRAGESQLERGRPNAWLDGFGHYFFSLPSKLVLLDWRVNDHDISPEVEAALVEYLHANGLCNTKVRVNQYAPGGEYSRLFRNREMPAGWRYTLGLLSVTFYTVFPERLFAGFPFIGGGDHYNPYTNTISIYSNRRPIALHEGGHAKDFAAIEGRHWKGLYAGARAVPFAGLLVALWQEADATRDALSWELATAGSDESKRAYRSLYPAYGTYIGGTAQTATSFFVDGWILYAVQYGVVAGGHVVGQTRALFVREREEGLEMALLEGALSERCTSAPQQSEEPPLTPGDAELTPAPRRTDNPGPRSPDPS